ncbi:hypothetical protein [Legionella spiritensis]|uniref:hypothetical protein n=1 Tax=Legionella spiritensis TaxID=452 RepID=UPI000F6CB7F6|nr:hypothetical protein [Legionella spiritensis]VEG91136.1 Uncharacterised protein [Legionella spiritensis]
MPKFFDSNTRTLFITRGKTPLKDLSENPLLEIPAPDSRSASDFRNHHSCTVRTYVSTKTGDILEGRYDTSHQTNADLEEVENTIYCP